MNILFVSSTRIGDAVLTTGLLADLVERHADARVTLACGALAMPLFAAAPHVVRRMPLVKRAASLHWLDLWRRCAWTHWDLVVDLRGSALAYLLAARRRMVYRRGDGDEHRVVDLARAFGLPEPPAPRIWTSPEDEAEAARLVPDGGPVLALGPTANWPGKVWRAEYFAALIDRLTAPDGILPDARVAVFAAAQERVLAQSVLDAVPAGRLIDLVGAVDLTVAAAALRRCALFVGNDSGLMHIAAAAGAPTLGLFGPSRPENYAPWGPRGAVARVSIPYEKLFPPDYDRRTTGTLMDSLGVDAVEEAATALWRRCGNGRS